jgi:antitoxin component YwqK of YwqJK toxin-antitoxin module
MNDVTDLVIAEIPYESGELRYRYSRYLAPDGGRWVRHGLFQAFHPNGELSSEGHYERGVEIGLWRDYHENGQLAAEGEYKAGKESGRWRFWYADGRLEKEVVYFEGEPVEQ